MAVRFDADGEDYTRALSLGSQSALTVACWFKVSADRNTWSSPFFIDSGQVDNWGMQTAEDGVTMNAVMDASTREGMGAVTVGTWYFVCLATSGTAGNLYYKAASAAGLTTQAITGASAVTADTLRLGESPWGGEWLDGCLAAVRVWNTQLSAAEAQIESMQYAPNRLANLVSFHPLVRPETTDYSGNARTLSGGTGATVEDGPPIPWRVTSPRLTLPASAGGTTFNLGQATETDAAPGATASKTAVLGLPTQADSAIGVTSTKVATLGLASEAESTLALAASKVYILGIATETDTASAITAAKAETLGLATETDAALGLSSSGSATHELGLASETDSAPSALATKLATLGVASEPDLAPAVSFTKALVLGIATEADEALALASGGAYTPLTDPVAAIRLNLATTTPRGNAAAAAPRANTAEAET